MKGVFKINIKGKFIDVALSALPKIGITILILVVGFWVAKIIYKLINRTLIKSNIDPSVHSFIKSIVDFLLRGFVVIIALKQLGVADSALIGVLSAAGLSIGFALKDSLSNFAGGFLILAFNIFKVGDVIQVDEFIGEVKEIKILNTKLVMIDNRDVTIPNGELVQSKIVNFNNELERRIEIFIKISHDTKIEILKKMLMDTINNQEKIVRKEEVFIGIENFLENSIEVSIKVWSRIEDYWEVYYQLKEKIKIEFEDKSNISYPKRNIFLNDEKGNN